MSTYVKRRYTHDPIVDDGNLRNSDFSLMFKPMRHSHEKRELRARGFAPITLQNLIPQSCIFGELVSPEAGRPVDLPVGLASQEVKRPRYY
jgi:hypothetical protein